MLLKSLELQGFKSFPDKTKIDFGRGLTAVVGPNGSGKSNISDAMRWVMGEQSTKTLRGSKMEDVIFTGTQQRKSQGFAQVSLIIDNADRSLAVDSDEVIITRRLSRSGESDYKINHAPVRLRDINELLMDTGLGRDGYALVGQGRIAEIVQSKSEQRREIFEEAAGISKFRYKKAEAQRKLDASEENLLRLRDILAELEQRVEPLKKQSEKAKTFLELSAKKRELEVALWNRELDELSHKLKEQADQILARQVEYEDLERAGQKLDEAIAQTYQKMQDCLSKADAFRAQKEELEQENHDLSSAQAVGENDIRHADEEIARLKAQIADFQENRRQTERLLAQRQADKEEMEQRLSELEAGLRRAQKELSELTLEGQGADRRADALSNEINRLTLRQSGDKLQIMQLIVQTEEDANTYENNRLMLAQTRENAEGAHRELADAAKLAKLLADRRAELENQRAGYCFKLESRQKKLSEQQSAQQALLEKAGELRQKARLLSDLEKSMEGFAYSVKAVVKQASSGRLGGVHGTVAKLLRVPREYAVAIETALGGSLQHLVVEDEAAAKNGIRFLKQSGAGRATFLPLTSVRGKELDDSEFSDFDGYIGLASRLAQADEKYRDIVRYLLGRVAVAEDLDTAARMGKRFGYRFKIVTLDGQVVNAGGSFSGGSRQKNAGLLSRAGEIASLTEQAKSYEDKAAAQQEQSHKLKNEVDSLSASLTALESEQLSAKEDAIRCEGEQKRLSDLCEQLDARVRDMEKELADFLSRLQDKNDQISALRRQQDETAKALEENQSALEAIRGQGDALKQRRQELDDTIRQLQLDALAQQKDLDSLRQAAQQLSAQSEQSEQTQRELLEAAAQQKARQAQIAEEMERARERISQNRSRQEKLEQSIQDALAKRTELEGQTTSLRQEEKSLGAQREQVNKALAKLEERRETVQKNYDQLIRTLWEEYELTRSQARQEAIVLSDVPAAKTRLTSVRGEIRSLGSVNLSAIEEYKQVRERYEFLSGELADVEKSRTELEGLIAQLTQNMEELFSQSFSDINRHFGKIFVDLFGGGKGELTLTDPAHVLESGIEINVQPPGKVIRHLSALSGGEQSFVAIAIYFAILKVRPAPFCILDEIEAALDDVNVTRYAEYLRLMSDNTQFIAITHRRGTMEEADVLYGVTMQEKGVSKLLKLDVSEIASQAAES